MIAKNSDGNRTIFNASTYWLIGNTLLFYQSGLAVNETHHINIAPEGLKIGLQPVPIDLERCAIFEILYLNRAMGKYFLDLIRTKPFAFQLS